jgi:hypothetical protein
MPLESGAHASRLILYLEQAIVLRPVLGRHFLEGTLASPNWSPDGL